MIFREVLIVRARLLLAVGLAVIVPCVGLAQMPAPTTDSTALEKRVGELEDMVRRLEAERAQGKSTAPVSKSAFTSTDSPSEIVTEGEAEPSKAPGKSSAAASSSLVDEAAKKKDGKRFIEAGWDDGFLLRSPDEKFHLRLTGQIQADYRSFVEGPDTTDIDNFLVRRARLGIEATVFDYFEFRLLPDFAAPVRIQDAYMNVHYVDYFQVEAGKFKQPFSYEQLIQDRFVPTIERSIIDQLVPARDVGFMVHGQKTLDDRLDYYFSVSNGTINGDGDTNDRKDINARIVVRPLNDPALWAWVRGLQFGGSATTGIEQELVSPNILKTPAGVPFFQYNSPVRAEGLRNRWSPELAYFYGPFGFATQYYEQSQELTPGKVVSANPPIVTIRAECYYVLATLLLTGETRTTYSDPIDPLHPFNPSCPFACGGAWELVSRVSRLHIGNAVFAPGANNLANPALYSSGCTEATLGFNWYLNKWFRVQFNYEHAQFDQPVQLGPGAGGKLQHQDTLLTRLQIIF